MSIVLLGYRGSGKSTAGRMLADRCGWEFVDTDEMIVTRAGKSIRKIFDESGEDHFRELEHEAVSIALSSENTVIATGGGCVLRADNRQLLVTSPHVRVYLQTGAQTLHARVSADTNTKENRPALTLQGGGLDEITALLALREPLYREVMTTEIDVTNMSIAQVVTELEKLL